MSVIKNRIETLKTIKEIMIKEHITLENISQNWFKIEVE